MSNHTEKIIDMLFLFNLFNWFFYCPVDGVFFSLLKSFALSSVWLLMILWIVKYGSKCLPKIIDDVFKIDIRRK